MYGVKAEMTSLKTEMTEVKADIAEVKDRLSKVEASIVETNEDVRKIGQSVTVLEHDHEKITGALMDGFMNNKERLTRIEDKVTYYDEVLLRRENKTDAEECDI